MYLFRSLSMLVVFTLFLGIPSFAGGKRLKKRAHEHSDPKKRVKKEDDGFFEIERFTDLRIVNPRNDRLRLEVKVRWRGYSSSHDTWESYRQIELDLARGCSEIEDIEGYNEAWEKLKSYAQRNKQRALQYRSLMSGASKPFPCQPKEEKDGEIRIGDSFQATIPELRAQAELKEYENIEWQVVSTEPTDIKEKN